MKKGQLVRGSKTLGLFVVTSVLLTQLFIGGSIWTASIASAQSEGTETPVVEVVPEVPQTPASEPVETPAPEETPVPVEETTPTPATVSPEPEAPSDVPAEVQDIPAQSTEPVPVPEETLAPETPAPVESTTDTAAPDETTTQDPTPTEPATEPAPETQVASVSAPTLTTDKEDYLPGETATIFGKYFGALQNVFLKIFGENQYGGQYTETTQQITTDDQGSFVTTYLLDNVYRPIYNLIASDNQGNELAIGSFFDSDTGFFSANQTVTSAGPVGTPDNGWTSNTQYAIFDSGSDTADYGFSSLGIPAGAVIDGIEVTIRGRRATGGTQTRNLNASLWNISNSAPDAYTTVQTATLTSTNNTYTLGGPTDKWGKTWTVSDFADADFKIRIGNIPANGEAWLDALQVKVYYTLAIPDLSISKVNDLSTGQAGVGAPFNWQLTVNNVGSASATFTTGQTIVTDELPSSGATFGSVSAVNGGGTTGTVGCTLVGSDVTCVASGGNVVIPAGGSITVTIPTTPTGTGTITNPRSGGVCSVGSVTGETNTANNTCTTNTVPVVIFPDLSVIKTNSLGGGNGNVGTPFNWTLTITNSGSTNAVFVGGSAVVTDDLPTTGVYGTVTSSVAGGTTGGVSCAIVSSTLDCTASGTLTIPTGGTVSIVVPVTPSVATTTFANPRNGGICAVDPSSNIPETSEINNGCADTVVVTDTTVPTVLSINHGGANPTNAGTLTWLVTFSEIVTGVNTGDFALAPTGVSGASITTVTGSGAGPYTVTVNSGSGSGTLGLDLVDDDTIVDGSTNPLSGLGLGNGNMTGAVYTIDKTQPTVTIDQAIAQTDPTSSTPVNFAITFSEVVTGFASNDITIGGTTSGTKTATISGTGPTYNVAISGMTSSGLVTVSIAANRVVDALGNQNTASIHIDNSVQYNFPSFAITSTAGTGGTITPFGSTSVNQGSNQTYVIAPSTGYVVAGVAVDTALQGRLNAYTFSNVTAPHGIDATFDGGWNAPSGTSDSDNDVDFEGNAYTSNDLFATFSSGNDEVDFTNFGLSIPVGATINGIEVALEGRRDSASTRNFTAMLSWNNGTNVTSALTGSGSATQDTTLILGGSLNTWGRSWSLAEFANGAFRVRVQPTGGGDNIYLDQVQVKVYYTLDLTAPVLSEVTPVVSLTNDNTPSYTFGSTEAGTITYGGDCSSATTNAIAGNTTVTFASLADGLHSNCTITVTDSFSNASLPLSISAFTVDTQAPVITVLGNNPETAPFGSTYIDAGATATEGATVIPTGSVNTAIVGDYTINYNTSDAAGNPAVQASRLVHVVSAGQTVTFNALPSKIYGDADFAVSATADSGLTVDFTASGDCSVLGTTVHILGAGSCTITAHQAGNANYNPAPDVPQSFSIAQAPSVTVVSCPVGVIYDGTAQTPCTATVTGFGGLNQLVPVIHTNNTDVGTAQADATFAGDVNHVGSSDAETFAITLSPSTTVVTCTPSEVYTGSPITPCSVSVTGAGGLSLTPAPVYADNTNVGTASASYAFLGDANHSGSSDTENFAITPKAITVTADAQSKAFGAVDPTLTYVSSDLSAVFSGALARAVGENVGLYGINQGDLDAGTNYTVSFIGADLTITQKEITVTADPKSKVYGSVDPALTYVSSDLSAPFVGALTRTAGENVGTYAIAQGTLSAGANYAITYVGDLLTITKANAIVSVTGFTGVYDGNAHGAVGSATGVNAEDLSASLNLGATFTNVPGGTANWTFTGGTNYNDQSGNVAITINKATPTIVVTPYAVTYDGSAHTAVGSATGVNLEALVGLDLSGTTHTDAGTYAFDVWTFTDVSGNYQNDAGTVSDSITKADAVISVTPYTVAYDGAPHTALGTATGVNSEDLSALLDLSGTSHTSAGTYPSDAWTFAGNTNYNSANGTVADEITKITASVTPDTKSKVYGEGDPVFTGALTGFIPTDGVTAIYSRVVGENIGAYAINATLSPLPVLANYDITYNTADLTITKAPLTVTADDKSKVYGAVDPSLTYQVTSGALVGVDAISGSLTRDVGETAETYPITQGSVDAGANYDLTFTPGIFTITQGNQTITFAPLSGKTYGDADFTVSATSDSGLPVDFTTTGNCTNTGDTVHITGAGSCTVTAQQAGDTNFTPATQVPQTFTIAQAPSVTVISCPSSVVYDGTAQTPCTATVTGFGGLSQSVPVVHTNNTDVGTAQADATFAGDVNHVGSGDAETFAITAKEITVTADPQSKVYGSVDPVFSYGSSESAPFTGTLSRAPGEDVGTYAIAQGTLNAGPNYTIAFVPANLTISISDSTTVVACPSSVTYSGSALTPCTVLVTGANGLNLTPTPDYVNNTDAGMASASYTYAGDANHSGSSDSENFTIDPKSLMVTVDGGQTKVYGVADPVFTYTPSEAALFTGALERALGEDVGAYAISQGTLSAGGNYTIAFTGANFAITQASSVTVIVCPVSVVYTGVAQTPCTANVTGAGGLNESVVVVHTNNTSVGTGEADATFAGDINHTGSIDSETFSITSASATVSLSDLTPTYDSTAKSATVVTTPNGLSAVVTYDGGATLPTDAGSYAVVATIADPNYSGSSNGVLVIGKAALSATANNQTMNFGDGDPAFTIAYSGFQGLDGAGDIDTPPTASVSGPHANVGSYTIDVSGGLDNNYDFTYTSGTLTVLDTAPPVVTTPADIILEAESATGTIATFTVTANDSVSGALTPVCTPASGSVFALGTTTVICAATDSSDNSATATFQVIVRDTTAPAVIGHPNIATTTVSSLGLVVSYPTPNAFDLVDGVILSTCSPLSSGALFPVGTTTIVCSATDSKGNTGSTSFVVVVTELPPVISLESTSGVSTSSVTITWTTNHPATSRVVYGIVSQPVIGAQPNYGYASSTVEDSTLVTNHSVTVTGLTPATAYYFRTVSHGSPEVVSTEVGTTTLALPLVLEAKGAIIVTKNTIGDNGTFNFLSNGTSSFAITTVSGTGTSVLSGLTAGNYAITENAQSGWTLTNNGCANVSVTAGATSSCTILNTKNIATTSTSTLGSISGVKFEDKNGNGVKNNGDKHLLGWTIYIDQNNNGKFDYNERSTVTDQNGAYSFGNLPAGTYIIREVMKQGWMQITPSSGKHTVTITTGQTVVGKNFGNFKKGMISAFIYDDKNGNGWFNKIEKGLKGWQAKLKLPNGTWVTKTVDKDGYVAFDDLGPGTYLVRQVLKTGWFQTSVNPPAVTITSGKVVDDQNDFGNKKI